MLQTMIDRIADQPFMFFMFVGVVVLLHIGAVTRMRHEAALAQRAHGERRAKLRVMPEAKFERKRWKRGVRKLKS